MLEEMGKRIKELRLKKSMSQSRLAELVGYKDKTAIAHIEAGRRDIPQSKLIAIAEALNVSPMYLLDGYETALAIYAIIPLISKNFIMPKGRSVFGTVFHFWA